MKQNFFSLMSIVAFLFVASLVTYAHDTGYPHEHEHEYERVKAEELVGMIGKSALHEGQTHNFIGSQKFEFSPLKSNSHFSASARLGFSAKINVMLAAFVFDLEPGGCPNCGCLNAHYVMCDTSGGTYCSQHPSEPCTNYKQ